jgi:hypothetical protein
MEWECSECGSLVTRERPPAKCRHCGTAGAIFVPADEGGEPDGTGASLRDRWIELGFLRATTRRHGLLAA